MTRDVGRTDYRELTAPPAALTQLTPISGAQSALMIATVLSGRGTNAEPASTSSTTTAAVTTEAPTTTTDPVATTAASTLACRILAKLGLRDLVQVVVFAYDVGLLKPKARH